MRDNIDASQCPAHAAILQRVKAYKIRWTCDDPESSFELEAMTPIGRIAFKRRPADERAAVRAEAECTPLKHRLLSSGSETRAFLMPPFDQPDSVKILIGAGAFETGFDMLRFIVDYLDRVKRALDVPLGENGECHAFAPEIEHVRPKTYHLRPKTYHSGRKDDHCGTKHAQMARVELTDGCYTPYHSESVRVAMTAVIAYGNLNPGKLVWFDAVALLPGKESACLLSKSDLAAAVADGRLTKEISARDIVRAWPLMLGVDDDD